MKIYLIITNEYDGSEVLLITTNLESAKGYKSVQDLWVEIWENEERIESLNFEEFKKKY